METEKMTANGHKQDVVRMPGAADSQAVVGGGHATLVRALIAAQRRARAVEKKARNAHHGYNYASADAIIDEASEALSMEGLAVLPVSVGRDPQQVDHVWQIEKDAEGEDASFIVTPRRILAVYKLVHESGEERDFSSSTPVIPERGRPEDKAEFGARTENLAYALRDLLLIPREDQGAQTPSARDDREARPRAPAAAAKQPAPAGPAPWRSADDDGEKIREDEIEQFDELIQKLKYTTSYVGMWLFGRFGVRQAGDLTRQQFKVAAKLLVADGIGKDEYKKALKAMLDAGLVKS
jgi:hypothetical protein